MLVQQVLYAIHTEPVASCAGKEHIVSATRRFLQPALQHGPSWFGERRTAFLASLSDDPQVGCVVSEKVFAFESGHLGQAQASLHGGQDEGVVTSARPGTCIRRREQGIDLVTVEKADLFARVSLAWNGEHSLDLCRMGRQFERRVAKEGMDCGKPQVAAAYAQVPAAFPGRSERPRPMVHRSARSPGLRVTALGTVAQISGVGGTSLDRN